MVSEVDRNRGLHKHATFVENTGNTMKHNLDGRRFRSVANSDNGEVGEHTIFEYHQQGDIVTAAYRGGSIVAGQLLARMLPDGRLEMRYHHLNRTGDFMLGMCLSTPEVLPDGRLRFHESWQWLSGDRSHGTSLIEEIPTDAPPHDRS